LRIIQCKIEFKNCDNCNNLFVRAYSKGNSTHKNCKEECRINSIFSKRKYLNGKKKFNLYFNKWINENVLLESNWELKIAEKLDFLNIKWIRPKNIKWYDENNKMRLYYPDFYLPDYDLYLDPKNPYCMKKDEVKMNIISKIIKIEYGNVNKLENFLENLV